MNNTTLTSLLSSCQSCDTSIDWKGQKEKENWLIQKTASLNVLEQLVEWKHNVFLQKSSITSDAWLEVMLMLCSQSYIDSYLFVAPADISVRCCARQKHPSLCSHTVCDCGKEEIVCVLHHFVHSQNYFSGVSVGICVHNEAHNFFCTHIHIQTHTRENSVKVWVWLWVFSYNIQFSVW